MCNQCVKSLSAKTILHSLDISIDGLDRRYCQLTKHSSVMPSVYEYGRVLQCRLIAWHFINPVDQGLEALFIHIIIACRWRATDFARWNSLKRLEGLKRVVRFCQLRISLKYSAPEFANSPIVLRYMSKARLLSFARLGVNSSTN